MWCPIGGLLATVAILPDIAGNSKKSKCGLASLTALRATFQYRQPSSVRASEHHRGTDSRFCARAFTALRACVQMGRETGVAHAQR